MEALIVRYGLFAVFVGAVLEGDVTLLLAGVVAHLGYLGFGAALSVGCMGALVADTACYGLAWNRRDTIVNSRAYLRVAAVVDRLVGRVGSWEIVITRLVYGTRLASMLYWGMRGLPFRRFIALDVLGCALWASVLASLGYAGSSSAAALVGDVKRAERWLLVALLLAAAAVVVVRTVGRRMRRRHP